VEVARLAALNAVSVGATLGSLAGYDRGLKCSSRDGRTMSCWIILSSFTLALSSAHTDG
jgi:hypothetical protein